MRLINTNHVFNRACRLKSIKEHYSAILMSIILRITSISQHRTFFIIITINFVWPAILLNIDINNLQCNGSFVILSIFLLIYQILRNSRQWKCFILWFLSYFFSIFNYDHIYFKYIFFFSCCTFFFYILEICTIFIVLLFDSIYFMFYFF